MKPIKLESGNNFLSSRAKRGGLDKTESTIERLGGMSQIASSSVTDTAELPIELEDSSKLAAAKKRIL